MSDRIRRRLSGRGGSGAEALLDVPPRKVPIDEPRLALQLLAHRADLRRQVDAAHQPLVHCAPLRDQGVQLRRHRFLQQAAQRLQLLQRLAGAVPGRFLAHAGAQRLQQLVVPVLKQQVVLAVPVQQRHGLAVVAELHDG